MNIIFLDAVQDFGGSQKSTISLMKNIKNEHEVLYVDFWGTESVLFDVLKENKIEYFILNKREHPIIIRENKNFAAVIKRLITYWINTFKLKRNLSKLIKEFKADIIIVNNLKSLSIINERKINVILYERTWFANNKINKTTNRLLNREDYFFAVSNATKNALYIKRGIDLNKIFVLQNSI